MFPGISFGDADDVRSESSLVFVIFKQCLIERQDFRFSAASGTALFLSSTIILSCHGNCKSLVSVTEILPYHALTGLYEQKCTYQYTGTLYMCIFLVAHCHD